MRYIGNEYDTSRTPFRVARWILITARCIAALAVLISVSFVLGYLKG